MKKLSSASLNIRLDLERDVDLDGTVGPVILNGTIELSRTFFLGLVFGSETEYESVSLKLDEDIGAVLAKGTLQIQHETASDCIDNLLRVLKVELEYRFEKMFEL